MDALRRSVEVSVGVARRPGEFTPLPGTALGCQHGPAQGRRRGGASMPMLLSDLVLFSCLLAFVTGIVIAVASLLS